MKVTTGTRGSGVNKRFAHPRTQGSVSLGRGQRFRRRIVDVDFHEVSSTTHSTGLARYFNKGQAGVVQDVHTDNVNQISDYTQKLLRVFGPVFSKDAKAKLKSIKTNFTPEDDLALQTLYINLCHYIRDRSQNKQAYLVVLRQLYALGLNYYEDSLGQPRIVTEQEFQTVRVLHEDFEAEPIRLSGVPLATAKDSLHAREAAAIRQSIEEGSLCELVELVFYRDGAFVDADQMIAIWDGVFVHLSNEERAKIVNEFKTPDDVVQMIEAVFDPVVYDRLVHVRLLSLLAALPNLEEVLEHILTTMPHLGVNLICLSQVELKHQTNMAFYTAYAAIAQRHEGWSEDLMEFLTGHGSFGGKHFTDGFAVNSYSDAHDAYLQALSLIGSGGVQNKTAGIEQLRMLGVNTLVPYALKENMAVLLLTLACSDSENQLVRNAAQAALKDYKDQVLGNVGEAVAHAVGATGWKAVQISRSVFLGRAGLSTLKRLVEDGKEYSRDAFKGYVKVLNSVKRDAPNDRIELVQRLTLPPISYAGVELPKTLMSVEQFAILQQGGAKFTNVILWDFADKKPIHLMIPDHFDYDIVILGGHYTWAEGLALLKKRVDFNLHHSFSIQATPEELEEFEGDLDEFIYNNGPRSAFYLAVGLTGAQISNEGKIRIAMAILDDPEFAETGVAWLKEVGSEEAKIKLRSLSFEDHREDIRKQAFEALCDLGDPKATATKMALDVLKNLRGHTTQMPDGTERVVYSGVVRLEELQDQRAIPFLKEAYTISNETFYVQAVAAIDCDESRVWLSEIMWQQSDAANKKAAIEGLEKIGHPDQGLVIADFVLRTRAWSRKIDGPEKLAAAKAFAEVFKRHPDNLALQNTMLRILNRSIDLSYEIKILLVKALGEAGDVSMATHLIMVEYVVDQERVTSPEEVEFQQVVADSFLKIVDRFSVKDYLDQVVRMAQRYNSEPIYQQRTFEFAMDLIGRLGDESHFDVVQKFLFKDYTVDKDNTFKKTALKTIKKLGYRHPKKAEDILLKVIEEGPSDLLIPAIKAYAEIVSEVPLFFFHNWASRLNRLDKNCLTPEVMQAGSDAVMRIVERHDLSGDQGFSAILSLGVRPNEFLSSNAQGALIKVQMYQKMILRSLERGETEFFDKPYHMAVTALKSKSAAVQVETVHLLFDLYERFPDDLKFHARDALVALATSDDFPKAKAEGFAQAVECLAQIGCSDCAYKISAILRKRHPEQLLRLKQSVLNLVYRDKSIDDAKRNRMADSIEHDFHMHSMWLS